MQIQHRSLYILRFSADIFALVAAFFVSTLYYSVVLEIQLTNRDYFLVFSLIAVWYFSARVTDVYDEFRSRHFTSELIALFKNVMIQVIASVLILFFMKTHPLSRTFVFLYGASALVLLTVERFFLRKLLYLLRKRGKNIRHILIVGAGVVGRKFHDSIQANPHFGYNCIGFLDDKQYATFNGSYLGTLDGLESIIQNNRVDEVVIALPGNAVDKINSVIKICDNHTTRVKIIPDYMRFVSEKYEITLFDRFPMLSVRKEKLNEAHWYSLKRVFDVVFSLLIIVLFLSWLVPLIALAIKLSSRGSVFFKQERWGRNNKKIFCYKFRSMIPGSREFDEHGKFLQASKNDPRVTPIGRFLRRTNLDELPQFWNVLWGQMSVVGPRPHATPHNLESKDIIQNYVLRHLVKPGITGWAQVNGYRGETKDPKLMQERINHDIWYIENWSFWLDIEIILRTVWEMIRFNPRAY